MTRDIVAQMHVPVGLARNPDGARFHCGGCEYFDGGVCFNKNPKLYKRTVSADWCCNLFNTKGMKVIVK